MPPGLENLHYPTPAAEGEAFGHELSGLIGPGVSHRLWLDVYSSCDPRASII